MQFRTQTITQVSGEVGLLSYPLWESFDPLTLIPELKKLLQEGRTLANILANTNEHTFASLVVVGEEFDEHLSRMWGTAMHLNNVMQNDALRVACEKGGMLISEYQSDIGQHEGLYSAYVNYQKGEEYKTLGVAQKKIIDDAIDAFEKSGVNLSQEKKARLKEINGLLSEKRESFENHLIDAQEVWTKHITTLDELSGIPADTIEQMRTKAEEKGLSGYVLTLQQPIVIAVLTHALDRGLRQEVFEVYNTRASELSPNPALDNGPLIKEILALCHEKAVIVGFENYAQRSLDKKMASSVPMVIEFLERLVLKSKDRATSEFVELEKFAKESFGITQLEPWDISYVSEKLRIAEYNVSDEELRAYFPAKKVFEGVFGLIEKIYGMRVMEDTSIPVWREGVKFYFVYDRAGDLRGGFYADLYAREKKRGGAWMDDCIVRRKLGNDIQLPIAYLNCNFTEPKIGSEGYLMHSEIETLFHEFGHVLHHILGKTEYAGVAMMHVEWDAVEYPSQVMENWCWDKEMLRSMSAHRETGAVIPDALCDRLISAKYFQSGMATLRQLEFAIVDMELYAFYNSADPRDPNTVLNDVRRRVRVTPSYVHDRFLTTFSHIFAGGYSAGYYSYKWAEVLAADAYEAYTETGDIFNPGIGALFLTEILEVGSSRPMMESFKKFRGREPNEEALIRQSGLNV